MQSIGSENETKYSASVSLINIKSGAKVGSGYAVCSTKENGKRNYQEFAICSMAQTRAIGKAYRNMLAWIIRAAGYEPTPAEEMDYTREPQAAQEKRSERKAANDTKSQEKPAESEKKANSTGSEKAPFEFTRDFGKATPSQKDLIWKMLKSSVFTGEDHQYAKDLFLKTGSNSKDAASKVIEWLIAETKKRRARQDRDQEAPAKISQQVELFRLLSHECIAKEEKDKMILNINRMNSQRITEAIENLKATIKERTKQVA